MSQKLGRFKNTWDYTLRTAKRKRKAALPAPITPMPIHRPSSGTVYRLNKQIYSKTELKTFFGITPPKRKAIRK